MEAESHPGATPPRAGAAAGTPPPPPPLHQSRGPVRRFRRSPSAAAAGSPSPADAPLASAAGGKPLKLLKHALALSYSRRTDGVADREQLEAFLGALRAGSMTPIHPRYRNECNELQLGPESFPVVTWLSKDYRNLIELWGSYPELARRGHVFAFTINGPHESVLEPGIKSTLEERYAQLARLAEIARGLGQDPDQSILVHLDPIVFYRVNGEERNNLGHVAALGEAMRRLGLARLHMSFMQFDFARIGPRAESLRKAGLDMYDPTPEEKQRVVSEVLAPAFGPSIAIQSCTYSGAGVKRGACFGFEQVSAAAKAHGYLMKMTGGVPVRTGPRACGCSEHRDVGDARRKGARGCTHGCRYCFAQPKDYDVNW